VKITKASQDLKIYLYSKIIEKLFKMDKKPFNSRS